MDKTYEDFYKINVNEINEGDSIKLSAMNDICESKVLFKDQENNVAIIKKDMDYYTNYILINNEFWLKSLFPFKEIYSYEYEYMAKFKSGIYTFAIGYSKNNANNTIAVDRILYIKLKDKYYKVKFNGANQTEDEFNRILSLFKCEDEDFLNINKSLSYNLENFIKNIDFSRDLLVNKNNLYSERSFNKLISPIEVEGIKMYCNPVTLNGSSGDTKIENGSLMNEDLEDLFSYLKKRRYKKIHLNPVTGKTNQELIVVYERDGFKLCKKIKNFRVNFVLFIYKYDYWFPCTNRDEYGKIKEEYDIFEKLCE